LKKIPSKKFPPCWKKKIWKNLKKIRKSYFPRGKIPPQCNLNWRNLPRNSQKFIKKNGLKENIPESPKELKVLLKPKA